MRRNCVVDTGVAMVANGAHEAVSPRCVAASARALHELMLDGHVFVDDGGRIVAEYRRNLNAWARQPGPGDAFLKWLLTHEWGGLKVTRVTITPKDEAPDDFHELPAAPNGVRYDPSDRKFLAVAAAHNSHPVILHSVDFKWWGWRDALQAAGVTIDFLCPEDVAAKYAEKADGA
jgi:hypothetical protein